MKRLQVGFAVTVFFGIIWAATGCLTLEFDTGRSDFLTGVVIISVGVIGVGLMQHLMEKRREDDARRREGRDLVWCRRDVEAGL